MLVIILIQHKKMIDVDSKPEDLQISLNVANNFFGRGVKHLRHEHKVSQQELEYFSGVQQSVISKIENGNIDFRLEQIVRIAQAFHLNIVDFFNVCYAIA